MDEFILTSPEEEPKDISMGDSIVKNIFDSPPKLKKKEIQKFGIESWNISQKLRTFQTLDDRYKTAFLSQYSSTSQRSKYRAKSALLSQSQDTNNHNFSNHKKTIIDPTTAHKKTISFFDVTKFSQKLQTSHKSQVSMNTPRQVKSNKIILLSRSKIQNRLSLQKEQRTKTIQNYLSHQKQIINREKNLTHSERIGKESLQFVVYPTQYWEGIKINFSQRKRCKKNSKNRFFPSQQNQYFSTLSPKGESKSSRKSKQLKLAEQNKGKSPIKRFHLFVDNLQKTKIG